jgi:hypothetical protein
MVASLEQKRDGNWKPLGFFSRKLISIETSYCIYDRELLTIYAANKFFKHMLKGRDFVIKTDYTPLIYAFTQKLDKANPRRLGQLDFISKFSTQIVHLSVSEN